MLKSNPYAKPVKHAAQPKKAQKVQKQAVSGEKPDRKGKGRAKQPAVDESIRAEVLALGGDDDDYNMITTVDSDSELEGDTAAADKALAKEIASFAKKLNFPQRVDASSDESSDEDDEQSSQPKTTDAVANARDGDSSSSTASDTSKDDSEASSDGAQDDIERAKAAAADIKIPALPAKPPNSPFIVTPTPSWTIPNIPVSDRVRPLNELEVRDLQRKAEALLKQDNETFAAEINPQTSKTKDAVTGLSKSDQLFIQQVLSSGTAADKASALLLLAASSPLHSISYLEQLLNICKKKNRDESQRAVRGVINWWCSNNSGCPPRKLKAFADQYGLSVVADALKSSSADVDSARQYLVVWAFEDWLKKWFFRLLASIEALSNDPLPHVRGQAVIHLSTLLREKPEQEHNVLRLLVNKLGDTNRSVASKASHHILQTVQVHPGIRPIVVREVNQIIFRGGSAVKDATRASHGNQHQVYYSAITLNQIVLRQDDVQLANQLLQTYLTLLDDIVAASKPDPAQSKPTGKTKKGKGKRKRDEQKDKASTAEVIPQTDSKLLAAVLTGINRAWPYGNVSASSLDKHISAILRACKEGSFNVSIQALITIHKMTSASADGRARLRKVLYASLCDPRLRKSSKEALYLNLLYRVLKEDGDVSSCTAILRRLVQITPDMDVIFALGALWIVGRLLASMEAVDQEAFASGLGKSGNAYDGLNPDPASANALKTPLWELTPLAKHWHPTVSQAARELLAGRFELASDELEQYSLPNFLDKMAYREHKKSEVVKGPSAMQAGMGNARRDRIVVKKGALSKEAHTAEAKKLKKGAASAPDMAFFNTYFAFLAEEEDKIKRKRAKRKGRKGDEDSEDDDDDDASIADIGHEAEVDVDGSDDDADEVEGESGSDLDEDEVWAAMQREVPGAAEAGDDFDDFEGDDDSLPDLAALDDDSEDGLGVAASAGESDDDDDDAQALFEDEDDLIPSDQDVSVAAEAEADEEGERPTKKRRKAKNVPMFASAEDYAHLLGGDESE